MWRMPLPSSASYKGMIAPPGYPNTRSTPSARKHCKKISAPLSIHDLFGRRRLGLGGLLARILLQPRHHAAQVCSHSFHLVFFLGFAQGGKILSASLVLFDPFTCEGARLNVSEDLLHRGAGFVPNNFRTAREIAIFRGVGNRITHAAEAAFVDQIDDELHLV